MQVVEKLVRKQYLVSPVQIKKLDMLAKKENASAAQLVRAAIDAYNPDMPDDMQESDLLNFALTRVKEAIADTRETRKRLEQTLRTLTGAKENV